MSQDISIVFVQESQPSGNIKSDPARGNALWIKASTGEIREYNEGTGVWDICPVTPHTHAEHGDINFTGTISADGEAGLTGSRVIDGHTLTFKNGLLVGYQAP